MVSGNKIGSIYPVILSGGSGTRLWPLSRKSYPKQLLPLQSNRSMLQETVSRVEADGFMPPLVICGQEHRFLIAEQLREIGIAPRGIVLEPMGRNTAPAVAVAALLIAQDDPDGMILVLASDHVIADTRAFLAAVDTAAQAAASGALVTFGIPATAPETGYGYIRRGAALDGIKGCFAVDGFVEKPDRPTAEGYLREGGYDWNSGMFLFSVGSLLEEMERYEPNLLAACRSAIDGGKRDLDFFRLSADAFAACPSVSLDYAVMEHTDRAVVVPAAIGWNDVGSWSALWEIGERNDDNNVIYGDVLTHNVKNSYIRAGKRMIAALGLESTVVVATDDVVFISTRENAGEVKVLVDALETSGRKESIEHTTDYRPWGSSRWLDWSEDGFKVRRISVKPGGCLSLQRHKHRTEHWTVLSGTAKVTRDAETMILKSNESTFIPRDTLHRLENLGTGTLEIVEIQTGDYLSEDDVERIDDVYGRV